MTTDELKAAAERLLSSNGYGVEESSDFCKDFKCVASYVLSRLSTDAQQYEYIATLERERDEARSAYCALRSFTTDCEDDETMAYINANYPDKPEWRKGCA